jgi:phospholipid/cholesterol/gamma-HCH transport system ATP-binding protein
MGAEICAEGLTESFDRQVVGQDAPLTLPAGEISVLLGPSGTGTSVFLEKLVGLLKPDRGSVRVAGQDITRLGEHNPERSGAAAPMSGQGDDASD